MDSSTLLVGIIVGIVIIGLLVYVYVRDQQAKAELRERGVTVTARVTGHDIEVSHDTDPDGNSTTSTEAYYVIYQYTVNGKSYSRRNKVKRETYDILREGQSVEVVYLPESPSAARLASSL
jgi:hypothetical protein